MSRTSLSALLLVFSPSLFAVDQPSVIHTVTREVKSSLPNQFPIRSNQYRVVEIDINRLYTELEHVPNRSDIKKEPPLLIELPLPDGTMHVFQVMSNSTMHPKLAAQFPEIKTFDAYGITNPGELVKFDITPNGFHAMILLPNKNTIFIDPIEKGNTENYIVYNKNDFLRTSINKCNVSGQHPLTTLNQSKNFANFASCELKKYRLALAATAQYTAFYGGSVPLALAAEITTVNRINGIYERDVAVTLELIPNNASIIYTNPLNQPYTSGNTEALLEENQSNLDAVIGSPNYDIGHVVDASSGNNGLAALASVCDVGEKAMGATTFNTPVGDPFDVDYVAHEMGHQFGANHTQNNSCNRNNATAVEPGSGSTIMGYAGICAPNVQQNSNSYFHGINLQEIGNFVSSPTHTCAVRTPIPPAPTVNPLTGLVIPANTPFALSAFATNTSGSVLTYTWEQMDNEISPQPPQSDSLGGPNFRSFPPHLSSTRFLPNLTSLANNGPFTWEVLPSVSRIMHFRVSVRNNTPGGSCNAYQDTTVTTDASAGPFLLNYPSARNIQWLGDSTQVVRWQVANTNEPPVNVDFVNILLSIDGGNSYPYLVATNVPNTGSTRIRVPNLGTQTARIMVLAYNGAFFSVSANNFTISPSSSINLTQADRNPMNLKEAFISYTGFNPSSATSFVLNGLPGATIRLDRAHSRFVVANIRTPRKVDVSITVTSNGKTITSNIITIPSIL
ncbi:Ser-Thr-rich glycosyl-phosphatidyl-inositol-anchored membrane family [Legionella beliardensis]|uniref:Ser-Thr-rich glycosyl-phosphatidyl-inositol-anchored membrane family n=1 Tax=Legionella beliardensis TaxID=91822 RepID=A0A378I059_9GAMM|nr:zinc-dependent metalloprotease family protein [Legionella beliardensis]STX28549.1 Ser-Thr-rich glycosyl-phosphatidyl-inositol-anchored membrane family [Legionella beliardensis]